MWRRAIRWRRRAFPAGIFRCSTGAFTWNCCARSRRSPADTGGNCGSQSSTLIIRGLAVDELHFADTLSILWKELRVALLVGLALAAVESGVIMIRYNDPALAAVVSLSLMCTVACAKVTGGLLPIAAKRLGLDPALMAAPLITTVVDTVAMLIYFTIATVLFHI